MTNNQGVQPKAASVDIDAAVKRAVAEHEAWIRSARPSVGKVPPRVYVSDDLAEGLRRPFRVKGRGWCVRINGVARLVNPQEKIGEIVFELDYSS